MIAEHWINQGYKANQVLKIIGISSSTYYAFQKRQNCPQKLPRKSSGRPIKVYSMSAVGKKISDEQIKEYLSELIVGEECSYGYRKLTICLKRQYGLNINKKKVYRLCKELAILKPQRVVKPKHPRKLARNRTIEKPNQLWEIDIKYGYIYGENRFFYQMSLIDIYDRSIVDYYIGLNCLGEDAARLVKRALWKRKILSKLVKPVIRSDNGPQFISVAFEDSCQESGVIHERIPPKTPNMNAHIESFHSILERDCYGKNEFMSYQEAYQTIAEFMDFYNNRYIHGSLMDRAPMEFHQYVMETGASPFIVTA